MSVPSLPTIALRILPYLPLLLQSNVLAISTEWICHLDPLPKLSTPIAPRTLSEIFRRSYKRGAWTFLFNLFGSMVSSFVMWKLLGSPTALYLSHSSASRLRTALLSANPGLSGSPLQSTLYGYTALFGLLHLVPFGPIIFPSVLAAADSPGKAKDEKEVKNALARWLRVNSVRVWVDVAGVVCALGALVVN